MISRHVVSNFIGRGRPFSFVLHELPTKPIQQHQCLAKTILLFFGWLNHRNIKINEGQHNVILAKSSLLTISMIPKRNCVLESQTVAASDNRAFGYVAPLPPPISPYAHAPPHHLPHNSLHEVTSYRQDHAQPNG